MKEEVKHGSDGRKGKGGGKNEGGERDSRTYPKWKEAIKGGIRRMEGTRRNNRKKGGRGGGR